MADGGCVGTPNHAYRPVPPSPTPPCLLLRLEPRIRLTSFGALMIMVVVVVVVVVVDKDERRGELKS
ncbi:hypothetical protein E2C01_087699 [Portunus trituberculatus]|uniref:Uncharacterized protein n=1 Tax=Portunus trituberculatus TaxID=210409 RepID=A0A5B7J8V6_PORTR|nr:hypothetical protein [Portunus trituberculatus]